MLYSIFDTCIPRAEIQQGELTEEIFAAKIRPVVENTAPLVYQDANVFFANTYPTDGIKTLIREVFGRLTGNYAGSPVIRLETSFGGGKTHDEIALWHICKQGRLIQGLERFVDLSLIPEYATQVAAIDGRDLDPENGIYHPETGLTTYTLWGEIAYQVGGIRGYELLKKSDETGVSPGTSVIERLVEGHPTVIILDEIARYLRAAKAKIIGNSNLAEQVVAFLFSLMDLAAASNHVILVYSLASAADTFGEETTEINETIRASARQERVLSPSTDVDIYNIVKQRIFESIDTDAAEIAAREYVNAYRSARLDLPEGCKEANYGKAIASSYPFHPELFSLLTKKIASIPEFQRTRGALRLFGLVVQHLWQNTSDWIPLIHTHHLPVGVNAKVTDELTSRLQRPLMRNPIQADIYNPNGREAYAQVQDQHWSIADKPPFSTWVARTIFLHSLTQGISSGIRRTELNLSLLTPGLEIGYVEQTLENLVKVAWYLDLDPVTNLARFKEEPSINKIISEEKAQVGVLNAKDNLRQRRDSIFSSKQFTLISGPETPGDVDDVANDIALCVIDFDDAVITASQASAPEMIKKIFQEVGEVNKFRIYRNRLLFLLANKQELERAINLNKEHLAIKNILASPNRLEDISENQKKQLKKKEGEMDLEVRIAIGTTYRHLFYPAQDLVKAPDGLMHYPLPAQDASTVKGNSNQQAVILKALRDCEKIRKETELEFSPAFILQKVWPQGLDNWTTKNLKEEFAKNLALNMPIEAEISKLRDTIRKGLIAGEWDLKVGEKFYIHSKEQPVTPPEIIEFSERMVLYRRGILEPPKPKEIEFNAELMYSSEASKPVVLRWRAKEALKISLYENDNLIPQQFRPSDEYKSSITQTTNYRLVADYGEGEIVEKTKQVVYPSATAEKKPFTSKVAETPSLFKVKPETLNLEGTLNSVFTRLNDQCNDDKVTGISELDLSVDSLMDYRKLGTSIGLFNRFQPQIEQTVTVQTGEQFLRLEYQGDYRGFQGLFSTLTNLLNQPNAKADLNLKVSFKFTEPAVPQGVEISTIEQSLKRNPVDKLALKAKVSYSNPI